MATKTVAPFDLPFPQCFHMLRREIIYRLTSINSFLSSQRKHNKTPTGKARLAVRTLINGLTSMYLQGAWCPGPGNACSENFAVRTGDARITSGARIRLRCGWTYFLSTWTFCTSVKTPLGKTAPDGRPLRSVHLPRECSLKRLARSGT